MELILGFRLFFLKSIYANFNRLINEDKKNSKKGTIKDSQEFRKIHNDFLLCKENYLRTLWSGNNEQFIKFLSEIIKFNPSIKTS